MYMRRIVSVTATCCAYGCNYFIYCSNGFMWCMYVCMYSRFAVQQWNDDSGQTLHHAEALGRGREQRNQQVRMLNNPCVFFPIRVGIRYHRLLCLCVCMCGYSSGDVRFDMNPAQLRQFLQALVDRSIIDLVDGLYMPCKKWTRKEMYSFKIEIL